MNEMKVNKNKMKIHTRIAHKTVGNARVQSNKRKHDRGRRIPANFLAHDKLNGQKWKSSCKWWSSVLGRAWCVRVCVCVFIRKSTNIYIYETAIIPSHNDSGLPVESHCFYLKRAHKTTRDKNKLNEKVRKTNQIYTTIKSEMVFDK